MKELCGYCCYLDVSQYKDGTYYCEKHKDYRYADENGCYKFCPRWNRDMHLGEDAIKHSKSYKEGNQSSGNFGCIVTNILVKILGFRDDSKTMNSFRELRNEYMQKNPICKKILMTYDFIGPIIVDRMNNDEDYLEVAQDLYMSYIKDAVNLINNKKYREAAILMASMLKSQMERYNIEEISDELDETYNQSTGGHGCKLEFVL